ncbi:MAG TPA: hypothetical protein PK264_10270 [Hyphomicrobiaceae bacterium]|nr:hypothetical protein [Hyphomicrobiaceae bacterium]
MPVSSAAIQSFLVRRGTVAPEPIRHGLDVQSRPSRFRSPRALRNLRLGLTQLGVGPEIIAFSYCWRADGILLYAVEYDGEPDLWIRDLDRTRIADHIAQKILPFGYLPSRGYAAIQARERGLWALGTIAHIPSRSENLRSADLHRRLNDLKISIDRQAPLIDLLTAFATSDKALCEVRRLPRDDKANETDVGSVGTSRDKHFALLHLRGRMGTRKNELERVLDVVNGRERSSHYLNVPWLPICIVAACIALASVLDYMLPENDPGLVSDSLGSWAAQQWSLLGSSRFRSFLIGGLTLGAIGHFYFWYLNFYRKRLALLTSGVVYFNNTVTYSATVNALYAKYARDLETSLAGAARPTDFPELATVTRSFEGVIDELKARVQHEQMKCRDRSIGYAVVAAAAAFVGKLFVG